MDKLQLFLCLVLVLVLSPLHTSFRERLSFGICKRHRYHPCTNVCNRHYHVQAGASSEGALEAEIVIPRELKSGIFFGQVALSGLISKQSQFSDHFVLKTIFEKQVCGSVKCISDDNVFARKRLVNPSTVYSGLFDHILFREVAGLEDMTSLSNAISGSDAWLAFNVSEQLLKSYCMVAVEQKVKRVVFAIPSQGNLDGTLFDAEANLLESANIDFTFLKYADPFQHCKEATVPFRIVPGESEIPKSIPQNSHSKLASGDLFRVLAELLDLKVSFRQVYGIGPGNALDAEIQVYLKAQGFSEHIQVGLLMGDLMQRIENDLRNGKGST